MIKNKLDRILNELAIMKRPDNFILSFPNLPVTNNIVNIDYFHAEYPIGKHQASDSGKRNLGDDLSPVIVNYMLQRNGIAPDTKLNNTYHLYAIGSILLLGYQNATVWGSGFLIEPSTLRRLFHKPIFRHLDVRCVRGPYTKRQLEILGHNCPEIYGDPAVLLPYLYKPDVKKTNDFIIIPHHSTEKHLRSVYPNDKIVSMNTADYKSVINKIVSSKKVITSSLHGIILSEAYGVPAVFYLDRPEKFLFKYYDWYASTNRNDFHIIKNLEEALKVETDYVPNLTKMQQNLIDSFPYDLWDNKI